MEVLFQAEGGVVTALHAASKRGFGQFGQLGRGNENRATLWYTVIII